MGRALIDYVADPGATKRNRGCLPQPETAFIERAVTQGGGMQKAPSAIPDIYTSKVLRWTVK